MELPKVDPLELESLQALVDALFQVLRPAIRNPLVRSRTGVAAFGGDDQSFRIGMKRLSDQKLARLRTIGVGAIYEVPSEIYGAFQNFQRFAAILRPPPDPLARDAHRTKPEAFHRQVP